MRTRHFAVHTTSPAHVEKHIIYTFLCGQNISV